jgi:hypothetical protein
MTTAMTSSVAESLGAQQGRDFIAIVENFVDNAQGRGRIVGWLSRVAIARFAMCL